MACASSDAGDSHRLHSAASGHHELPVGDLPLLLTIAEAAFLLRVGARTVWRLMADPKSKFPQPRRIRGRTFLVHVEVVAYAAGGSRQ